MEQIFSSSSTIDKKVEITNPDASNFDNFDNFDKSLISDFDSYFEINQISEWIKSNNFKRIALQFPDELLAVSVRVCSKLNLICNNDCTIFLLADTTFGSCCVDVVASEHYDADSIVHFGHSCLNIVDKIPVYYVFEKLPLNIDEVNSEINRLINDTSESIDKLIILYDASFKYLFEKLIQTFSDEQRIFVSKIYVKDITKHSDQNNSNILFARILPDDLNSAKSSYSFYYIGSKDSFLNPFLFYFSTNKFYQFNPQNTIKTKSILFSYTNKELMKRYYLIEKAKDSKIFGILIGTMSVANYNEAIDHVSSILKSVNRRYYSFLIGKLNCPKLNNFMEIDMYVLVACNENSLISSKELNKPIITIYELEIAFNCARLWNDQYVCDFRQLLPGNKHYIPLEIDEKESDVSLITGETRILDYSKRNDDNTSLVTRDSTLSVIHHSGAGEFLSNRSWTGLNQNLGKTEVTKTIEGIKGIASRYEHDKDILK